MDQSVEVLESRDTGLEEELIAAAKSSTWVLVSRGDRRRELACASSHITSLSKLSLAPNLCLIH